jgi:DNA-binding GntR family transcriptional regulator
VNGIDRLSAITSRSTSVVIAEQLTERIVDGSFRPGEQINEAQVASQLSVSRGPVREALQRLVQEGLLISKPNRGVFVRELTAADVTEIYAAREVIECAAAEIIVARASEERASIAAELEAIVDRMVPLIAAQDWGEVARLDLAFHTRLVEASGNTRLHRAYLTLATETLISMSNLEQAYPYENPDGIAEGHRGIARLVGTGEIAEVRDALHQHLSSADDYLSYAVDEQSRNGRAVDGVR